MKKTYRKPRWSVKQITRETGLVEDICKCGVGHPNSQWIEENDPEDNHSWGVHGCCGCCSKSLEWWSIFETYKEQPENDNTRENELMVMIGTVIRKCDDLLCEGKFRELDLMLLQLDWEVIDHSVAMSIIRILKPAYNQGHLVNWKFARDKAYNMVCEWHNRDYADGCYYGLLGD